MNFPVSITAYQTISYTNKHKLATMTGLLITRMDNTMIYGNKTSQNLPYAIIFQGDVTRQSNSLPNI